VPEGHTVHRLARDHRADLAGRVVRASSPQGRFAEGAARIDGTVAERFEAWGKHELGWFAGGEVLHVHLGLIGKWARQPSPPAEPVGQVRLRLEGEGATWDLAGPATCALVTPEEARAVVARLGPDPLRRDADPERFVDRVLRSPTPIGALLLDQGVIAGVGNVYRAEVLWELGIDPRRPGRSLDRETLLAMWAWLRHQLRLGVRRNRIVTVDPSELAGPIKAVRRGEGVAVYHQEACRRCGGPFETIAVAGRRIERCPTCQT
jgi:endonuclease-8